MSRQLSDGQRFSRTFPERAQPISIEVFQALLVPLGTLRRVPTNVEVLEVFPDLQPDVAEVSPRGGSQKYTMRIA